MLLESFVACTKSEAPLSALPCKTPRRFHEHVTTCGIPGCTPCGPMGLTPKISILSRRMSAFDRQMQGYTMLPCLYRWSGVAYMSSNIHVDQGRALTIARGPVTLLQPAGSPGNNTRTGLSSAQRPISLTTASPVATLARLHVVGVAANSRYK